MAGVNAKFQPKNRVHPEHVRKKIRAAYLIRRLQLHVAGKIKMTADQIRAADILLRKIIPDLTQTSVTGELTHKYVAEVPPLLTKAEWLDRYRVTKQTTPQLPVIIDQPPTPEPLPTLPAPKPNGHDDPI